MRSLREYLQFCVCIQQQIHRHRPPQALTTSTSQLSSTRTHTDTCSQKTATAQHAQNEASSSMTDPRYPAVTASEGEGSCTARLCRLLHTAASLKATQGQWHHSAQPPTQGTTEGRRAPCFFVSRSDVQNLAAINHRIYIFLKSVANVGSRDWVWQFCWLPHPKNLTNSFQTHYQ